MNKSRNLTSETVLQIFGFCKKAEDEMSETIYVDGVLNDAHFDVQRLKERSNEIVLMLNELPEQFQKSGGGGWSFLNACDNRFGEQWTEFHSEMETLFMLGKGLGFVSELFPRALWNALPGAVPYYVVDTNIGF